MQRIQHEPQVFLGIRLLGHHQVRELAEILRERKRADVPAKPEKDLGRFGVIDYVFVPPLENRKAGIAEQLRRRALAVLQILRAARKGAQHAAVSGQHRDEPVAFADRLLLNN